MNTPMKLVGEGLLETMLAFSDYNDREEFQAAVLEGLNVLLNAYFAVEADGDLVVSFELSMQQYEDKDDIDSDGGEE